MIMRYDSGDYGLFNGSPSELNQDIILEQYKLFLQTSEDLVSRRQNVNSFYISISSASVAVMGGGYGNLNSSKMKIISNIEKQLPLSLFDTEWAALSDELNRKKYVSFTESEQMIPRLFCVVSSGT